MRTAPAEQEIENIPHCVRVPLTSRLRLQLAQQFLKPFDDPCLRVAFRGKFKHQGAKGINRRRGTQSLCEAIFLFHG